MTSFKSEIKVDRAFRNVEKFPVTRHHIPEDPNIHRQNRENPKSPKYGCRQKELEESIKLCMVRSELRMAVTINTALLWEGACIQGM